MKSASDMDRTGELATARLGPLLFKYSWPALVAMSLNALYSVVDRFYIGCGCGEDANGLEALYLAMKMQWRALPLHSR